MAELLILFVLVALGGGVLVIRDPRRRGGQVSPAQRPVPNQTQSPPPLYERDVDEHGRPSGPQPSVGGG